MVLAETKKTALNLWQIFCSAAFPDPLFAELMQLYTAALRHLTKSSKSYNLDDAVLLSWIEALSSIRYISYLFGRKIETEMK